MMRLIITTIAVFLCSNIFAEKIAKTPPDIVPNTSLEGKWLTGYQAWFRTPSDGTGNYWTHYSAGKNPTAEGLVVDMWPDTTEFPLELKDAVPEFFHPNGEQAYLYSSVKPEIIDTHFRWMKEYDIDGVWLQRFVVGLPGERFEKSFPTYKAIMDSVVESAKKHGRVWGINFDPAASNKETVFDTIITEWKRMVDEGLTKPENRYIQHNGLPVVHLWNMHNKGDRFSPIDAEIGLKFMEFFKQEGPYKAFLISGATPHWANDNEPEYIKLKENMQAVVPWNIGNYGMKDGVPFAATGHWAKEKNFAEEYGMIWIPTIYPGFSWKNMNRYRKDGEVFIDRCKGEFLWGQFAATHKIDANTLFLAMFDEVDEATAFFKVSPEPPTQAHFVGTDGMPSDWWLQLVREARRIYRSGEEFPKTIPIKP